jgi:hypothetical protein
MNGIPEAQMCEDAPSVNPTISIVREIPLSQGKFALVDEGDYDRLSKHTWSAVKRKGQSSHYAEYRSTDGHTVAMHREVLGLTVYDGKRTDHKNRNGLDNRRSNLRVASPSINTHNGNLRKNNTSGYRGVYWHKRHKRWGAKVVCNGKHYHCGEYNDKLSAVKARDVMELKLYGTDAVFD